MSKAPWEAERTVGISINGENVRVIEIAETAKPYEYFSTIGYVFSSEHADTIIAAVNSHQAMKEALEDGLHMIIESIKDYEELMVDDEKSMTYGPWVADMYNTRHKIEKALTLANGGQS